MKRGFSLVELSIVLVILGLLVGGVLSGQALIRAAELRSVVNDYSRFYAATNTFRDKYFAAPGDMTNASSFWGLATFCTPAGTSATGTCDGNGNGALDYGTGPNAPSEFFTFWQQLALAGLIEGSYTGIAGPGGVYQSVPGTNSPKARISGAGWGLHYLPNAAGDSATYAVDYGNDLIFGLPTSTNPPYGLALKPEEAWNIDTKLDDGRPGYGRVIARNWNNSCATGGASQSDLANSYYNLSNTSLACSLNFIKIF